MSKSTNPTFEVVKAGKDTYKLQNIQTGRYLTMADTSIHFTTTDQDHLIKIFNKQELFNFIEEVNHINKWNPENGINIQNQYQDQ